MHDVLTIGIPLVAILAGILFNRQDVLNLRTDMNRRFDLVDARFDWIQRDMREFYAEQARHDVRLLWNNRNSRRVTTRPASI